jgi:uncharacterized RDD family membrane protein YckC
VAAVREDWAVTQPGQPYSNPPGPPSGNAPGPRPPGFAPGPHPAGYAPGPQPPGYAPGPGPGYPSATPPAGYTVAPATQAGPYPGYRAPARPSAPNGQPLAEFTDRLLARLIDWAILTAIATLLVIPVIIVMFLILARSTQAAADGSVEPVTGGQIALIFGMYVAFFVLILAAQYAYEVELPKRTGQTVGKRVMKIRVVPLDPHVAIGRGPLVRRWLVFGLAGAIVPFLSLLSGLWQLWDQPYRQCLHDKFARTVVVKGSA